MRRRRIAGSDILMGGALAVCLALPGCAWLGEPEPTIVIGAEGWTDLADVPFVVSDERVVRAMLDLADVRAEDVVYDLGCGDGRLVIDAAQRFGARGVGIDMDPFPLRFARARAERTGVGDRVRFVRGDLFKADLRGATVVTLYLSPEVNQRLLPKLLAELRPGARIVSHKFDMGTAWLPQRTRHVGDSAIHLWVVPEPAATR